MAYLEAYPPVTEEKKERTLGEEPYIHPSCIIRDSSIGTWAALGPNTWLVESTYGRQCTDHLLGNRKILLYRQ